MMRLKDESGTPNKKTGQKAERDSQQRRMKEGHALKSMSLFAIS